MQENRCIDYVLFPLGKGFKKVNFDHNDPEQQSNAYIALSIASRGQQYGVYMNMSQLASQNPVNEDKDGKHFVVFTEKGMTEYADTLGSSRPQPRLEKMPQHALVRIKHKGIEEALYTSKREPALIVGNSLESAGGLEDARIPESCIVGSRDTIPTSRNGVPLQDCHSYVISHR